MVLSYNVRHEAYGKGSSLRVLHQDIGINCTFDVLGVVYCHFATSSKPSSNRDATKCQCVWASSAISGCFLVSWLAVQPACRQSNRPICLRQMAARSYIHPAMICFGRSAHSDRYMTMCISISEKLNYLRRLAFLTFLNVLLSNAAFAWEATTKHSVIAFNKNGSISEEQKQVFA